MKILKFSFLLLFISFIISCKGGLSISTEDKTERNLLIPLYKEDKRLWTEVINLDRDNLVAVVNPYNGAGTTKSQFYDEVINNLIANNKKPIGYLYTSYGKRNINEVKNEIDRWLNLYPNIEGFFIDEVSGSKNDYEYYEEIYFYIKSKGNFFIVFNVGSLPSDDRYFSISDNIVVYENDVNYFNRQFCDNNPSKSTIIVYNASKTDMENIIKDTSCKYVYITDDNLDNLHNPYDTLPNYLKLEAKLIGLY